MSSPRVRPTFDVECIGPASAFLEQLGRAATREGALRIHALADGAILRLPEETRRLWSPALYVHVEEQDGKVDVRGRFSPSSPVWTAFVAIYVALLCVFLASASYGLAQWTLEEEPWALLGMPISIFLAGFTYGAAFIGQGLGAEDMHLLRGFVERVASDHRSGAGA